VDSFNKDEKWEVFGIFKSICNGRVNFLCKITSQNSIYLV
jgi:hypothetical protein